MHHSLSLRRTAAGLVALVVLIAIVARASHPQRLEREITSPETRDSLCPDDLKAAVDKALASPALQGAHIGVRVEFAANGSVLYESDSQRFFTPASNNKIPTTAAAYMALGAGFTFNTTVWAPPLSHGGAVDSLCLRLMGDPSLNSSALLQLAGRVAKQGVASVAQLVVDDSYYTLSPSAPFPAAWEWEDLAAAYGAAPTAAILDENTVTVTTQPGAAVGDKVIVSFASAAQAAGVKVVNWATTGPSNSPNTLGVGYQFGVDGIVITGSGPVGSEPVAHTRAVQHPARRIAGVFAAMLRSSGVAVNSSIAGACGGGLKMLEVLTSPPLSVLMNHTLQWSDNLYAETWSRTVGKVKPAPGPAWPTTPSAGLAAVSHILSAQGVDTKTFVQNDGSGVSRHNLIQPAALTQILRVLRDDLVYRSFLPVAGESGTLAGRFRGTAAQGIVHAKTGTLTGVNALSGYVAHPQFPLTVFSILQNHSPYHASTVRQAIDAVVVLLAQLVPC